MLIEWWESQTKFWEALEEQGNAALEGLSDLICLTLFDISHANVSDIFPVSNLTNLKEFGMCDTNVSDISPLNNLTNLTNLNLIGTNVSEEDCKELDQKLGKGTVHCPF